MKKLRLLGCILGLMGILCMIPYKPAESEEGLRAQVVEQVGDELFKVKVADYQTMVVALDGEYTAGDSCTMIITKGIEPSRRVLVAPNKDFYMAGCIIMASGLLLFLIGELAQKEILDEEDEEEEFDDTTDEDKDVQG